MDQTYLIFNNQVKDAMGNIIEAGTPQNAQNFNKGRQETLAANVFNAFNACYGHWQHQKAENAEIVDCIKSQALTGGTAVTIVIPKSRNHIEYTPVITILSATSVVAMKVSDKQLNGFKITAIGSDATVSVGVRGGMW